MKAIVSDVLIGPLGLMYKGIRLLEEEGGGGGGRRRRREEEGKCITHLES